MRTFSHTWFLVSPTRRRMSSLLPCWSTFSTGCIQMVERAISSSDLHSSADIEAGFLLYRMASTYLRIISTSCIISFHRAKFLPSNFQTQLLYQMLMPWFFWKWDLLTWSCSFNLFCCLLPPGSKSLWYQLMKQMLEEIYMWEDLSVCTWKTTQK